MANFDGNITLDNPNGILTSSRISNCYKIKDMKYYGEQLISDKEIAEYIEKKRAY